MMKNQKTNIIFVPKDEVEEYKKKFNQIQILKRRNNNKGNNKKIYKKN